MNEPNEGLPTGQKPDSNTHQAESTTEAEGAEKPKSTGQEQSVKTAQEADSRSVANRLRKVRKLLFPDSHPEREEKIALKDITEAKVAQTILDYRPGHNRLIKDNNFSSNDIMIQLGWEEKATPEEMEELQATTNRHLSNLISAGGLKAIPIQDKDGRIVRRDYQATDAERAVLENIVKNSTPLQQPQ